MGELDTGDRSKLLHEPRDASEWLNMFIKVNAAVGGTDPTFRRDCGRLNNYQPSATDGTGTKMDKVPIVGKTVIRGILAHGRDANAVL